LTEAEIKAHLESFHKLKIGATHTHALLTASVSKGLKSYVQVVTKGKPNPYMLWELEGVFEGRPVLISRFESLMAESI